MVSRGCAAAFLLTAVCVAEARATPCPLFMRASSTAKSELPVFEFEFSGTCKGIILSDIKVYSESDQTAPVCDVHVPAKRRSRKRVVRELASIFDKRHRKGSLLPGRVFEAGWKYGSVPHGFVAASPCKPLARNERYVISVSGTCFGYQPFEIDQRGRAIIVRDPPLSQAEAHCGPQFHPSGP